jgi:hypothetical protein
LVICRTVSHPFPDLLSDDEIEATKRNLQKIIHLKKFDQPLPLAYFCLIAHDRWMSHDEESPGSGGK